MIMNFLFFYIDSFMKEYAKQTGEACQPVDDWSREVARYVGKCCAEGTPVEICVKHVIADDYR